VRGCVSWQGTEPWQRAALPGVRPMHALHGQPALLATAESELMRPAPQSAGSKQCSQRPSVSGGFQTAQLCLRARRTMRKEP